MILIKMFEEGMKKSREKVEEMLEFLRKISYNFPSLRLIRLILPEAVYFSA